MNREVNNIHSPTRQENLILMNVSAPSAMYQPAKQLLPVDTEA
jgi:hypothetical protein